MKVFCTGANGFICQHIVKRLAEEGNEVVAFDLTKPTVELSNVQYR